MQPHVWLTHMGLLVNLGGEISQGEIELNIVAFSTFKKLPSSKQVRPDPTRLSTIQEGGMIGTYDFATTSIACVHAQNVVPVP